MRKITKRVPPARKLCALAMALCSALPSYAYPAEPAGSAMDHLVSLSIEQLLEVEITSVAKHSQKVSEAAAAVFVISQEDLRRSGVTSIPEALRMVPGLEVARIDGNKWAVTSRGFNSRFANKLLVLMDGRSVYAPLFSGVWWDVQDTVLEDIDRIEVIRGPGAALWGANAVNGVINIITKRARDTQGLLVTATGGNMDREGATRYGGVTPDGTYYRLYTKYSERADSPDLPALPAHDDGRTRRAGFRADKSLTDARTLTVQGDIYSVYSGGAQIPAPLLTPPFATLAAGDSDDAGGNLLGRWRQTLSGQGSVEVQAYFDRTKRFLYHGFTERQNTFDLEFQHGFGFGERQYLLWGAGVRYTQERSTSDALIGLVPPDSNRRVYNLFVQDDVTVIERRLRMTLGAKLEHHDTIGFAFQPNARVLWTPDDRNSVWVSVARALRTPAISDTSIRADYATIPGTPPILTRAFGNPDVKAEDLTAYELGYRTRVTERLALDVATFYNDYRRLQTVETGTPFFEPTPIPHLVLPLVFSNQKGGHSYGFELAADWRPLDWWQIKPAYTFLQVDVKPNPGSTDTNTLFDRTDPRHQVSVRSLMNVGRKVDFDLWVRHVDAIKAFDTAAYTALDARLAWRPTRELELSLVGQNLLDQRHFEFGTQALSVATEVPRSVFLKLKYQLK